MNNEYSYIPPQDLKDISKELKKIIEYKEYENLENLVEHIDKHIEYEEVEEMAWTDIQLEEAFRKWGIKLK